MAATVRGTPPYKLNVGCGRNIRPGWLNLDVVPLPGVDLVCDLERLRETPIDLPDDSVEQFLLSHVIEHVKDTLGLMQELWRVATPGAVAIVRVPHGGNDDAWEDPTHVRPFFIGSWGYFSQPYYWRADYGFRGDWRTDKVQLLVPRTRGEGFTAAQIFEKIQAERNMVQEMVCEMRPVKPIREPKRELQTQPQIEISLVG
jgi:SAM-dependent methyltransferase